jgi:hypothetical protein
LFDAEDCLSAPEAAVRRGGRVALLRNPLSRRNRDGRAQAWDADVPDLVRAEPEGREALRETLSEFERREVGLVVVDGGDGTVREVLTALPEAYAGALPALAVLASGTTNLIAADVGAGRSAPDAVAALSRIAREAPALAPVERRAMLEVVWPDGSHPPVRGMFLGACAFTRATDLSMKLVRQGRVDEGAGVAATLLSAMAQTVVGPERERWLQGDGARLAADGGAPAEGPRFLVLATTLHKLLLGLWPFWGEGEGEVRWLDIAAPPKRLAAALPAVLRGRPRPWMAEAGYLSGRTQGFDLALAEPFVVDGEHFAPGPAGEVRVRAGPVVDFVVP